MRVWCKKSVAYATEILQIFEKNQTNRQQVAWKSRIDYTDSPIDKCKRSCKSVLYITEIN